MTVPRRDEFLNKRRLINPNIQAGFVDSGFKLLHGINAHDAAAASADIWFYQQRESDRQGRGQYFVRAINDVGLRKM